MLTQFSVVHSNFDETYKFLILTAVPYGTTKIYVYDG